MLYEVVDILMDSVSYGMTLVDTVFTYLTVVSRLNVGVQQIGLHCRQSDKLID